MRTGCCATTTPSVVVSTMTSWPSRAAVNTQPNPSLPFCVPGYKRVFVVSITTFPGLVGGAGVTKTPAFTLATSSCVASPLRWTCSVVAASLHGSWCGCEQETTANRAMQIGATRRALLATPGSIQRALMAVRRVRAVNRCPRPFLLAQFPRALRSCRLARLVGRVNGGACAIACDAVGAIDAAGLPWTIVRRRADTHPS
jgi:hypothetical protein